MAITLRQVNQEGTKVYMGTLTESADIHTSLADIALEQQFAAATFELLGGLQMAEFTEYNFGTQKRNASLRFERPLEIVGGHGTISWMDEAPHVHLHLALSFQDEDAPNGMHLIAGHAAKAQAFAVEVTITAHYGERVQRVEHSGTGLKLWKLPEFSNES